IVHSPFHSTPAPPPPSPLSLHDALPISTIQTSSFASGSINPSRSPSRLLSSPRTSAERRGSSATSRTTSPSDASSPSFAALISRSEEHTSELQSLTNLVCRLLLEKKNNN